MFILNKIRIECGDLRWTIIGYSEAAVNKHKQANDGRKHQPCRVEAQPRKVECQFFAKVLANDVQWLVDKEILRLGPIFP